jgi:hypothetical protein
LSSLSTRSSKWQYAVYAWNAGATDATLLDLQARTPVDVTVGGQRFTHQIPSREDCGKCHEANATAIIGFDETRLAWAPSGTGETELGRFRRLGLISGGPSDPPATDRRRRPHAGRAEGLRGGQLRALS